MSRLSEKVRHSERANDDSVLVTIIYTEKVLSVILESSFFDTDYNDYFQSVEQQLILQKIVAIVDEGFQVILS